MYAVDLQTTRINSRKYSLFSVEIPDQYIARGEAYLLAGAYNLALKNFEMGFDINTKARFRLGVTRRVHLLMNVAKKYQVSKQPMK